MLSPRMWLQLLALGIAVLTAILTFATNYVPTEDSIWIAKTLVNSRSTISWYLLFFGGVAPVVEGVRAKYGYRMAGKPVVEKILDDLSRQHFRGTEEQNRITLYKCITGRKQFAYCLLFMPLQEVWRRKGYLLGIKWGGTYLGVYSRPTVAHSRSSSTAWKVGRAATDCEGVAGLVWTRGWVFIPNLPDVSVEEARGIASIADAKAGSDLAEYVKKSNISTVHGLRASDVLSRHFCGTIVRVGNGRKWGVLLVDSTASECPFEDNGPLMQSMLHTVPAIGRIVEEKST